MYPVGETTTLDELSIDDDEEGEFIDGDVIAAVMMERAEWEQQTGQLLELNKEDEGAGWWWMWV